MDVEVEDELDNEEVEVEEGNPDKVEVEEDDPDKVVDNMNNDFDGVVAEQDHAIKLSLIHI